MNNSIKKTLDNPHSLSADVTFKELNETIEGLSSGEFVKIEYRKVIKRADKRKVAQSIVDKINEMSIKDMKKGKDFKLVDELLNSYHGEVQVGYYKKPDSKDTKLNGITNPAGFILFQDEDDQWKSVEIKNVLNLTTIEGVKMIRNVG